MKYYKPLFLILFFLLITTYSFSQENKNQEFRGVWIATVENIDWPSSKNLSTEQQKKRNYKTFESVQRFEF
ncbi:MAG: hypothetical protein GQ552_08700 [Flavobacteriaceae bacterium]|nr:hypothetical protein [Flavobacteriaceae bacterium]